MSSNKMKGLLKGLRYISQIFDAEKEPEMQIGHPTDVKHVAHIGWDGPSVNSPSWMNDFEAPPGFSSAPLSLPGELRDDSGKIKWVSEARRGTRGPHSPVQDLPELPRSSRRQSSSSSSSSSAGVVAVFPTREKVDKPKSRRSSKGNSIKDSPEHGLNATRQSSDPASGSASPTYSLPDIPKKARRKKSKECSPVGNGGSTRSSRLKPQASETYQSPFSSETYQSPFSDPGPGSGSGSGSVSTPTNNELCPQSFEHEAQKGFAGIY